MGKTRKEIEKTVEELKKRRTISKEKLQQWSDEYDKERRSNQ